MYLSMRYVLNHDFNMEILRKEYLPISRIVRKLYYTNGTPNTQSHNIVLFNINLCKVIISGSSYNNTSNNCC